MLKFGNHKLGDDTAIFNMGTATSCPSRLRGLCEVCNNGYKCYALKAEQQYPNTVPQARENQKVYWKTRTGLEIASDFIAKIRRRRKETLYFRFNESGDFESQSDVTKLNVVANALRTVGVTTYGYTARRDLRFTGRGIGELGFLVKTSGGPGGNNGQTCVIGPRDELPEGYLECPGSCKRCNLCKINVPHNIAFRKH